MPTGNQKWMERVACKRALTGSIVGVYWTPDTVCVKVTDVLLVHMSFQGAGWGKVRRPRFSTAGPFDCTCRNPSSMPVPAGVTSILRNQWATMASAVSSARISRPGVAM